MALISTTRLSRDKMMIEISCCTYCDKLYHIKDTCFELHPNLKKIFENNKKKKKKMKREELSRKY